MYRLFRFISDFEVDEHIYSERWFTGFGDYLEVFQPAMVCGTTASLNEPNHALISASMALRFFGTTDAIGKTIYVGRKSRNQPLVIGGVYQDMPLNSQLGNCVFSCLRPDLNKDSWSNWNYVFYFRLDTPASLPDVRQSVIEAGKRMLPKEMFGSGDELEDFDNFMRFTPLDEVHYSMVGNKAATSKAAVYLLLCVSVLILLTAAVNYMNFSLAETPMRLRSINTQKVLGASTFSLRMYLLLECVRVSAFITLALSVARYLPEYLGSIRPLFGESSGFAGFFRWNSRSHGFAGWSLSLLLCYFFPAGTGVERFVRSFSEREDAAYVFGLFPVFRFFHADYCRGHHVSAKPLHSAQ